jgi:hypothetical protein
MNIALTDVVEGWTGALPFTLKADGSPVDLTGLVVSIVLKDAAGTVIKDSTAGVTVTGSTGGQVEYGPSSSDFVASGSPYRVRFRVRDAQQKAVFFPNGDGGLINVRSL